MAGGTYDELEAEWGFFEQACVDGDVKYVRECLHTPLRPLTKINLDGGIQAACSWGRLDVLREIVRYTSTRGADYNDYNNGFVFACSHGNAEIVSYLLSLTDNLEVDVHYLSDAAFETACYGRYVHIVHILLGLVGKRTIDLNADDGRLFVTACVQGDPLIVSALLSPRGDHTVTPRVLELGFRAAAAARSATGPAPPVLRTLLSVRDERQLPPAAIKECGCVEVWRELQWEKQRRVVTFRRRWRSQFGPRGEVTKRQARARQSTLPSPPGTTVTSDSIQAAAACAAGAVP